MREKLRQKIEKEVEIVFEPIFSSEDDTIASYMPLERLIQWKMDVWAFHVYNKFRQLGEYFRDCGLPFIDVETFTYLALTRSMEHEVIHSADDLGEITERNVEHITNKFFVERLISVILERTHSKITSKLPRIRAKEMRGDSETMLRERKRRSNKQ